jgi:N-acetylglucosaminyldiphosphoundecaprenol N-acetyl-beta-D-mannosaminyltransferase
MIVPAEAMNAGLPTMAPSTAAGRASQAVDFERDVYCIGGLPIDAIDMQTAVEKVRHAARSKTRCVIATPNLNFVISAQRDAEFRESVIGSDLCLADGMPLVWMARLLKLPIPERVAGSELFDRLLAHDGPPITVYFFGGPPGAGKAAGAALERRAGGLRCVGYEEAPYAPVEALSGDDTIDRINRSGADFVIVALGARKGQAWIERNRARLTAPVLCHLGAVINFAAGTVSRAPRPLQVLGLEWLWRIKEEPSLWRRYSSAGLVFIDMLCSKVLPKAWRVRVGAATKRLGEPPTLEASREPGQTQLSLKGAWTRRGLAPLRAALAAAARDGNSLRIALDGVIDCDSAFVAVLMLALAGGHGSAWISSASSQMRRILHDWDADFLLRS